MIQHVPAEKQHLINEHALSSEPVPLKDEMFCLQRRRSNTYYNSVLKGIQTQVRFTTTVQAQQMINEMSRYPLVSIKPFMFSFKNSTLPSKFNNFFSMNNQIHNYSTRSAESICLQLCTTSTRQFSVYFQGQKFYNSLNAKITKSPTYIYTFYKKA